MVASESTSKRGSDWRIVSVGGKDRPDRPKSELWHDNHLLPGDAVRVGLPEIGSIGEGAAALGELLP